MRLERISKTYHGITYEGRPSLTSAGGAFMLKQLLLDDARGVLSAVRHLSSWEGLL
jgi:hypothetical protein